MLFLIPYWENTAFNQFWSSRTHFVALNFAATQGSELLTYLSLIWKHFEPDTSSFIKKSFSGTLFTEVIDFPIAAFPFSSFELGLFLHLGKKKSLRGFVAPFLLRYHGPESLKDEIDQYNGRDVVLLNIWKTRCNEPRVDTIIWLPWEQGTQNSIIHFAGPASNSFLRLRYSDPHGEYPIEMALLYASINSSLLF